LSGESNSPIEISSPHLPIKIGSREPLGWTSAFADARLLFAQADNWRLRPRGDFYSSSYTHGKVVIASKTD